MVGEGRKGVREGGREGQKSICHLVCLMKILSSILLDLLELSHCREIVPKQVATITHLEKKRLEFSHL